jgi:hypothetical protein
MISRPRSAPTCPRPSRAPALCGGREMGKTMVRDEGCSSGLILHELDKSGLNGVEQRRNARLGAGVRRRGLELIADHPSGFPKFTCLELLGFDLVGCFLQIVNGSGIELAESRIILALGHVNVVGLRHHDFLYAPAVVRSIAICARFPRSIGHLSQLATPACGVPLQKDDDYRHQHSGRSISNTDSANTPVARKQETSNYRGCY